MKKMLVSLLIGLLSITSLNGADDNTMNKKGFYVGAGVGSSSMDTDNDLNTTTYDGSSATHLYVGYQFNNVIALELGRTDYGDIKNEQTKAVMFSPTSTSLNANVGYSFLDSQLRVAAVIGISALNMNQKQQTFLDDSGIGFNWGATVQYEPNGLKGFGIRAGYTATSVSVEERTSTGSTTNTYTQTLSLPYIAVQYKF